MKRLPLMVLLSGMGFASPLQYTITGQPAANFNFRVTLIPVPGSTSKVQADLKFDPTDLQKVTGSVRVDLRHLDTGISLRDDHARNFLEVASHPRAEFKISRITGIKKLISGQELQGFAEGSFLLKGILRPLKAPIKIRFDGKTVQVSTHFDVVLKDHGIQVPGADDATDVMVMFNLKPR
ncbi:YceI family protein [Deinococcus cellulosilyticus]|uniref:YceI family protein n=1 Tax=Deinococcus cellulosilyticus TaxID=401558 RepID=UPI0011BF1ACA|nr:YceI family protein [Deinococcus cellulosilyticus]